jgi:hypothetical protein
MKYITGILIGIIIGIIIANVTAPDFNEKAPHSPSETITAPKREIMSIRELQQALNDLGHSRYYCGEVDGIWGSKTAKALDNFICDRNYKESTYGK